MRILLGIAILLVVVVIYITRHRWMSPALWGAKPRAVIELSVSEQSFTGSSTPVTHSITVAKGTIIGSEYLGSQFSPSIMIKSVDTSGILVSLQNLIENGDLRLPVSQIKMGETKSFSTLTNDAGVSVSVKVLNIQQ